ncbi:GNAT family N-acetyltransferase [uncultured Jatrophihabitans sp.]|uniref:GNAT family N-acetyltransferase n=1 Tax=uncultured Jatrophihabitans sp. TaxID=1610747 RepID=UPI0035CA49B0
MITANTGLPDELLAEIGELEQRVVAADGGRLKLEWKSLHSRSVDDVVAHEDGRLIAFVGVYRHGGEPELTGMVDPAHRRRRIGAAILTRAVQLVRDVPSVLLVVPRASAGGRQLALTRGGVLDHSEHALRQSVAPPPAPVDEPAGLHVRPAGEDDRAVVDTLIREGFGDPRGGREHMDGTAVAELDGRVVATLAVERHNSRAGVYGFVVDPALQGRGIGRAVLGRMCRDLRADGVEEVHLEVEVRNERALGLYTSLGFEPVTTEDYYRLATSA